MQLLSNIFKIISILILLLRYNLPFLIIRLKLSKGSQNRIYIIEKIGDKFVKLLPSLGPAFIKMGQILATRSDIIGPILSKKLEQLQDRIKPCDFKKVQGVIENAINYSDFDIIEENAISAASIAQVHKGLLKSGQFVAIKVLRPGVNFKFKDNLDLLRFLSKITAFFLNTDRLKLSEVINRVEKMSIVEMDLRMEAAAADKLRENLEDDKEVYVPKIFWQYITSEVLVSEWIDGIAMHDKENIIKRGFDIESITKNFAVTFFNQAFRDGFFHADLHQGNILIDNEGRIVFLDFGIMGNLDYMNRIFVAEILKSFLERNYRKVAELHVEAGFIEKSESIELFELACRSIGETILNKPSKEVSISSLLKQLFDIAKNFNMSIQPQLLLLQKTMVTVEGVSISLNNNNNIWLLIRPWIKKWARSNLGIRAMIAKRVIHSEKIVSKIIKNLR